MLADGVARTELDAFALKPTECDLSRASDLPVEAITIDWEGCESFPDRKTLAELARERDVRVTIPVRVDGFDPLGDDRRYEEIPAGVGTVLVAGHPAYLTETELTRAIAPRLGAAIERFGDPWVGTEGIERLALATGATQFELLSRSTERDVRALRAGGFGGSIAVYAPTVLVGDSDEILDAIGDYVARRRDVSRTLPADPVTDARATGTTRRTLEKACAEYALVGSVEDVRERVESLKTAGVDRVVGYPARGMDRFLP